jgi:hypothetical protein
MTGDKDDIIWRIRSVIPTGWFADQSPVLDALLAGFAASWCGLYALANYALKQTRIGTSSHFWLDLSAFDFFGPALRRLPGQSDESFRGYIQGNLLREKATRRSVISTVESLTGRTPLVFEPAYGRDTGFYSTAGCPLDGLVYNVCGGWGSLLLPYQIFITAYRPNLVGVAFVSGWGCPSGAYGAGSIEYGDILSMEDQVSNAKIRETISDVLPVSVIAWTRICN